MRCLFVAMLAAAVCLVRPIGASACSGALLNCSSTLYSFCTYDGDSIWYTMYSYTRPCVYPGSDNAVSTTLCDASSSCYFTAEPESEFDGCIEYDQSGFISCGGYACVGIDDDGDYSISTGSSEYCCSGSSCTTDCD
jgi:hypothetical protein